MRLLGSVVTCAMLLFARPTWCQASRDARSTEKSKQELLDLENHWLQVENDPMPWNRFSHRTSCTSCR